MGSMVARRRWIVLLALLAGAAWLAAFGDKTPIGSNQGEDSRVVGVAPRDAGRALKGAQLRLESGPRSAKGEEVEAIIARASSAGSPGARPAADLFAAPMWHVSPQRAVQVPPLVAQAASAAVPSVARAPEPGYRVIGKKQETGRWEVYLDREDASHVARVGEIIESIWRVERIAPPTMTLMHLPTQQERHLSIGEAR